MIKGRKIRYTTESTGCTKKQESFVNKILIFPIFTRADKGNSTIAMNKDVYMKKTEDLLNDKENYIKNKHQSITKNRKRNKMVKKWFNNDIITKKEYYFLYFSDSLLPKTYGLPKIHKDNILFRIIVSSVNTSLHHLVTHLHNILSTSIPKADSFINNS